jgi:hypothetical protein
MIILDRPLEELTRNLHGSILAHAHMESARTVKGAPWSYPKNI